MRCCAMRCCALTLQAADGGDAFGFDLKTLSTLSREAVDKRAEDEASAHSVPLS